MPFADHSRAIAGFTHYLRDSYFLGVEDRVPVLAVAHLGHPHGIRPREEGSSRHATDRVNVKVCHAHAFGCHLVKVGRRRPLASEASNVSVTNVVQHEYDHVRMFSCGFLGREDEATYGKADTKEEDGFCRMIHWITFSVASVFWTAGEEAWSGAVRSDRRSACSYRLDRSLPSPCACPRPRRASA